MRMMMKMVVEKMMKMTITKSFTFSSENVVSAVLFFSRYCH